MYSLFLTLAGLGWAVQETALRSTAINLDKVLDGHNLTAVVEDAKTMKDGTIQVLLAAHISSLSPPAPALGSAPISAVVSTPSVPTDSRNLTSIKIIYAAEDPASVALLRDGLSAIFSRKAVQNVSLLHLVPYGNAIEMKVNTLSAGFLYWHPELQNGNITNVYRCPNGEGECETSLIHACAVKASNSDPSVFLPFISCMASAKPGMAPEDSSFSCSNSTVFMETLRTCALGREGIALQHELAAEAAVAQTVPAIYINDQLHPFNITASVSKEFTKLVCDALFAKGRLDRDQCEGATAADTAIVVPFESLLTQPVAKASSRGKL